MYANGKTRISLLVCVVICSYICVDVFKYIYDITDALKEYVGLRLVGPYLILAGQLSKTSWEDCVLQSRHFYDTPEVQTVLESTTTGYHIGYFRSASLLTHYKHALLCVRL